jgi:hypothetical protein
MSARGVIARLHGPLVHRASAKSVDQLSESERLRITRFVVGHEVGHEPEQPETDSAWLLEVYGFGSSTPLARQHVELPIDSADRPAALDRLLASLSLVRWGASMADPTGAHIEGCCVQDFADARQPTLSARHVA